MTPVTADLTRPEDIERMATAMAQWGQIDILVNNVATTDPNRP